MMQIQVFDSSHPRHKQVGTLVDSESLWYLYVKFEDGKIEVLQRNQCIEFGVPFTTDEDFVDKIEQEYNESNKRANRGSKGILSKGD